MNLERIQHQFARKVRLGSGNLSGVLRINLANKWLINKAEHRNRMEECNYHGISK